MCGYLHPDRTPEACVETGYLEGALTQSSELQASFAGSTVRSVQVRGDTAVAKFDNGNQVLLSQDPDGAWKVLETPRAESSGSEKVVQPK